MKGTWVIASFWEEHCTECGMPVCFGACGMFERGWHGRCVRVDGFEESIRGAGVIRFRRWGKIEQVYHGRMMDMRVARAWEAANRLLRGVWRMLGMRHRAVRWRLVAMCGRRGRPDVWRMRLKSERSERLVASVAGADGREAWRETIAIEPGEWREFAWRLPAIGDGALLRVFPMDGEATGWIEWESSMGVEEARPGVKCVAWDLDGVVWDGTLSEGDDVRVRPGVMEAIRALDRAGIVSSVCSKNDAGEALKKLKELGIGEWFVFPQVNWGAKSESLKNLAMEMNVGLDAIAFVDDRAENRAEVAANCPGVRVLDENECLGFCRDEAARCERGGLGARRREMYREEMARRAAARGFAGGGEAFAEASGLEFELLPIEGERAARCRELVQRTNQLNLTARRYGEAAFAELLRANECVAVRAWDRYGDYGIVGFLARRGTHLVECCFSCRSAGRGIERKVLAAIAGGRRMTADVVVTARNAPIREIVGEFL